MAATWPTRLRLHPCSYLRQIVILVAIQLLFIAIVMTCSKVSLSSMSLCLCTAECVHHSSLSRVRSVILEDTCYNCAIW